MPAVAGARSIGIGTNIGEVACPSYEVTVFDMQTFEVVNRYPSVGPATRLLAPAA